MLTYDIHSQDFLDIVDVNQNLQVLAQGFTFTEGPIWNAKTQEVTFSDIPVSKLYRWSQKDGLAIVRTHTNKANGNVYDQQGRIVSCEHGTSRLVRFNNDGSELEVVVSKYQGKELNSPNDIIMKSDGTLYFSDPEFGRRPTRVGIERPVEQAYQNVFFVRPGETEPTIATNLLTNPNGLCFSADESKMYVADSPNYCVYLFDVAEDGTLIHPTVFCKTYGDGPGVPDGLKIDRHENVICAAQGGLHFFNKEGTLLGVIYMPEQAANFCFGDEDGLGLYITGSTTLYKIRLK